MKADKLIPDFVQGEYVVVIDKDGQELCRGPLMAIKKSTYGQLEFKVGSESHSLWPGYSSSKYILNAERLDMHLRRQIVSEMSDVADKFISYARGSLTPDEMDRVEQLASELTEIGKAAAEREYEGRDQKGASPEIFQSLWANKALTPEAMKAEEIDKLMFSMKLNYSETLSKLDSLEQSDRVVELATGKPIVQKALRENSRGHGA